MTHPALNEVQIKRKLWERGDLEYLLKGDQHKVKAALVAGIKLKDIHTVLCSRRFGKSFILCCWAFEVCLKKPRSTVKYACPEQKQVRAIFEEILPVLLDECPEHLKPVWKEQKNTWYFPNGSKIQIAAVNKGRADSLRGGAADLCIVDEAGFVDRLSYVILSVLSPTIDTTKGNIVMASTPNPDNPMHEFHTDYVIPLLEERQLIKFTLYESPMVDAAQIEKIIARFPMGVDDPRFQCEYMCMIAVDKTAMAIPTFSEEVEKDIVRESKRPAFYDIYVSGDPAASDLTGILFGYWDFRRQVLVIEDELVLGGKGTSLQTKHIASGIKRKEKLNFTHPITQHQMKPFRRIMDNNNPILINDLRADHELMFIATAKDNKYGAVDKVNKWISEAQIEINPKCKVLRHHLRTTKWKVKKDGTRVNEFSQVGQDSKKIYKKHHGDLVDALVYMVRNVMVNKNPFPTNYEHMVGDAVHMPEAQDTTGGLEDLAAKLLNIKKRR